MMSSPVSSTPVLRATLQWSAWAALALAIIAGVAGFIAAGPSGLVSGLAGVVVGAVFLSITSGSILIANRWFGDALYVPIFFAIVLGGWLLKIVLFVVAMLVLRGQPWIAPQVFFLALVAAVIGSLVVDVVVLARMRLPHVSDTTLPTDPEAGERKDPQPPSGI
ncbi:MAG: hypothetical protein J0I33_09555 [Microbacterium ginsengisoli]|jgi:hypothetical protein|uniref:hypothetical protein n=1 Tax=Microbacterium TaxID=33882 RepID=UPI0007003B06|nr:MULTISPECIES: hypothetical protein [unclassified Microbacterium]KQR92346.1 hypothetical protein ASG00_04025 [Microbacterium sp. Leaf351]KQR92881.1 hypothetical protein ASF93_05210 [Microbacterium sp. Leaf347]MBN9198873.1 hypothetical protein [Microbacterium ginsengisoli]OJU74652.1 MAG: hypothetical protein BGO15_08955 [Microbacterium sp. 71-23]